MPTFDDPVVEAIYVKGMERINRLKAQLRYDEAGILILPAPCEFCERPRTDIVMMSGDGLPICSECFEGTCNTIGAPAPS
jgi:hypothetical protein